MKVYGQKNIKDVFEAFITGRKIELFGSTFVVRSISETRRDYLNGRHSCDAELSQVYDSGEFYEDA